LFAEIFQSKSISARQRVPVDLYKEVCFLYEGILNKKKAFPGV